MTETFCTLVQAQSEHEFYPLSPSLDVNSQPARVRENIEKHFPGWVIVERLVVRKWRTGYPYEIYYCLMQSVPAASEMPGALLETECYDWS